MSDPTSPAGATAAGNAPLPPSPDSVRPFFAGALGAALIVLGLIAFVGTVAVTSSSVPTSLGFGAVSGVALLSVTLVGLIVLTRAIGLADATQALGLPNGSVRALLALVLAIVFVAVASWTLGGMFDTSGPLVFEEQGAQAKVDEDLKQYGDKQYVVSKTIVDGKETATVHASRPAPDKDLVDLAKQIVTISATVLVTVVGFYFGSKSASDAVKSAGDSLTTMRKALADIDGGDDDSLPTPPTADFIQKSANAIGALASATAAKIGGFGASPLDLLSKAVAENGGNVSLPPLLEKAKTSFATMTDRAKSCDDAATKAKQLAALPGPADPTKSADIGAQVQSVLTAATQANHDFEQAFSDFSDAYNAILGPTAVG
jgi:hypothetical protein